MDPSSRQPVDASGDSRWEQDAAFYGIPYAQPPFGRLRFAAPEPVDPWTGVIDATKFAPTAPQPERRFTLIPEPIIDGGDAPPCLSLNVFTPGSGSSRAAGVRVDPRRWFYRRDAFGTWYDGAAFTRDGVVVVSIGYRLGCEGFLALEGAPPNRARARLPRRARLGAGQHRRVRRRPDEGDHRRAVRRRWHGHDPRRAQPRPRPVPRRHRHERHRHAARRHRPRHAHRRQDRRDGGPQADPRRVRATRHRRTHRDPEAANLDRSNSITPTIDGSVIAASLPNAIEPALPKACRCSWERRPKKASVRQSWLKRTFARRAQCVARPPRTRRSGRRAFRAMYPKAKNGELRARAITDSEFRVGPVRMAERRAAAGAAPTFLYETAWRTAELGGLGAVHCIDVPFAFDCLAEEHARRRCAASVAPQAMADAMHGAFVSLHHRRRPRLARLRPRRRPGHHGLRHRLKGRRRPPRPATRHLAVTPKASGRCRRASSSGRRRRRRLRSWDRRSRRASRRAAGSCRQAGAALPRRPTSRRGRRRAPSPTCE